MAKIRTPVPGTSTVRIAPPDSVRGTVWPERGDARRDLRPLFSELAILGPQRRETPALHRFPHLGPIEASFGPRHSLAGVSANIGGDAGRHAERIGADAYTVGEQVVFRQAPSLRLAAHEAAHAVQQRAGRSPPGGVGRPGDPWERQADSVAARVVAGRSAADLLPGPSAESSSLRLAFQAQYGSATGVHNPKAYIPIADLIRYVEAVERAYPGDTPTDILTRIRVQYYSGTAFEQLIPQAHTHDIVQTYSEYGPVVVPRILSPARIGQQDPAAYDHLSARADENAIGDNPSPYIVLPNGEQIDLGHLLLGMDALVHPSTSVPYSTYGVPNIDPASWVADVGIAAVWMTQHVESGSPPSDAPVQPPTADMNAYWLASAPEQDLLGDVDSFGVKAAFAPSTGGKLSESLRAYYLGASGGAPGLNRRFRTFCSANSLAYTLSGGVVTWDPGLRATLIARVDRFNDLFGAGKSGAVWGVIAGPSHRAWPFTPDAVDRFLAWLKPKLEAEIRAHP